MCGELDPSKYALFGEACLYIIGNLCFQDYGNALLTFTFDSMILE